VVKLFAGRSASFTARLLTCTSRLWDACQLRSPWVVLHVKHRQFPNYFEAGFLSSRTIHRGEGRNELLKVIGAVKRLSSKTTRSSSTESATSGGSRVFVVHGHDEAALNSVARFIEKLDIPVTILRDQPSEGRTTIEKFQHYADVGFAMVILTGDDVGGTNSAAFEDLKPRARQNVVFELGFFVGKLGRRHVCALYEAGVELPSDYVGVAFVALDAGQTWKLELAREMKAAGLPIDMNKVF
jgi:predicted nucleotide-binding protein